MRYRAFVVDDHPVVRMALRAFLEEELGIAVCGEAASYEEAIAGISASSPDFVLVDLSLGDGKKNGFDLVEYLHAQPPDVPTLIVSSSETPAHIERARRLGARGYVTKRRVREALPTAIRQLFSENDPG